VFMKVLMHTIFWQGKQDVLSTVLILPARESRNFTPEDYCSKHIRAQLQLTQAKHGRQPHAQVQDFLDHMYSSLNFIKTTIISHPEASQDLIELLEDCIVLVVVTMEEEEEKDIIEKVEEGEVILAEDMETTMVEENTFKAMKKMGARC